MRILVKYKNMLKHSIWWISKSLSKQTKFLQSERGSKCKTPSNFVKINLKNLVICSKNSLRNLLGVLWLKMQYC